MRVFDWDTAAQRIMEVKPSVAGAGLEDDWEWSRGTIWRNGKPIGDNYTYLCSIWATPELEMDGVLEDCWRYQDETEWDEHTKWPASALKIVGATEACDDDE